MTQQITVSTKLPVPLTEQSPLDYITNHADELTGVRYLNGLSSGFDRLYEAAVKGWEQERSGNYDTSNVVVNRQLIADKIAPIVIRQKFYLARRVYLEDLHYLVDSYSRKIARRDELSDSLTAEVARLTVFASAPRLAAIYNILTQDDIDAIPYYAVQKKMQAERDAQHKAMMEEQQAYLQGQRTQYQRRLAEQQRQQQQQQKPATATEVAHADLTADDINEYITVGDFRYRYGEALKAFIRATSLRYLQHRVNLMTGKADDAIEAHDVPLVDLSKLGRKAQSAVFQKNCQQRLQAIIRIMQTRVAELRAQVQKLTSDRTVRIHEMQLVQDVQLEGPLVSAEDPTLVQQQQQQQQQQYLYQQQQQQLPQSQYQQTYQPPPWEPWMQY